MRVLFAMARDGLLPRQLAKTGSHGTPVGASPCWSRCWLPPPPRRFDRQSSKKWSTSAPCSRFLLVSAGVIVLRRSRPDLPRGFRAPMVPLLPIASVCACVWLMVNLTVVTWGFGSASGWSRRYRHLPGLWTPKSGSLARRGADVKGRVQLGNNSI